MPLISASASLSAAAVLVCSVLMERITITPGNVIPGGSGIHGPLAISSYVEVPGIIDGVYDT